MLHKVFTSVRVFIKGILVVFHLLFGLLIVALSCQLFKHEWHFSSPGKFIVKYWLWALRKILNVRITVDGVVSHKPVFFVSNHISWTDIIILGSLSPLTFLSRSDVADWPLIGRLSRMSGTLFIDRETKSAIVQVQQQLKDTLEKNKSVLIFPEGGTSDGKQVKPFKSPLYQAAVDSNCEIQSIALEYEHPEGYETSPIPYIDDDVFFSHMLGILKQKEINVKVSYTHIISDTENYHRKELATITHQTVRAVLE